MEITGHSAVLVPPGMRVSFGFALRFHRQLITKQRKHFPGFILVICWNSSPGLRCTRFQVLAYHLSRLLVLCRHHPAKPERQRVWPSRKGMSRIWWFDNVRVHRFPQDQKLMHKPAVRDVVERLVWKRGHGHTSSSGMSIPDVSTRYDLLQMTMRWWGVRSGHRVSGICLHVEQLLV